MANMEKQAAPKASGDDLVRMYLANRLTKQSAIRSKPSVP